MSAIIIFVGFFLTFLPQFVLGYNGMPRRYHNYPPEFQVWNVLSTAGASILVGRLRVAAVLFLAVAALWQTSWSKPLACDRTGMANPLAAALHNFEETPTVVREPYQYHIEKAQNEL